MGLLDNQFMKLVLSGSPYMQARETQRRQDELAGRVQGLIGQPGMAGADDGLGLSMQPGQIGTPGTGLLGGQMTQPQFAAQLMGIPGLESAGSSMMNNQFTNQAAMQRQQQEQDWNQDRPLNTWENAQYGIKKAELKIKEVQAAIQSKFGMTDEGRKNYNMIKGPLESGRNILLMGKKAMDMMPKFSNGEPDFDAAAKDGFVAYQLVSTLAKSILGNEAVMSDDRTGIINAPGATGSLKNLINEYTKGGGKVGKDSIKSMLGLINQNMKAEADKIDGIYQQVEALPGGSSAMPPRIGFEGLDIGQQRPAAQSQVMQMPSDVKPLSTRGYTGRRR